MNISMLKGKIHRATVKQAELDYVGSITVDPVLLEAAGILEYEHVHIVDVNNGSRFETYTIPGEPGSGMICLNGPAARCVATGDKIIIIAYADMTPEEAKTFEPKVVFVDDENQISLTEAKAMDDKYEIGDFVEYPLESMDFGRMAAQKARSIIIQNIKEGERDAIYERFACKEHDIVNGVVQRFVDNTIYISLDEKTETRLKENEQVKSEHYKVGDHIKLYVVEVKKPEKKENKRKDGKDKKNNTGINIHVSRTHPELVKRLFENEIEEIQNGVVEIMGISRDAGSRSKLAVRSLDPNVDPVGACVGMAGARVNTIVDDLKGEKIDVIAWDEDPEVYIKNALSPSDVIWVQAYTEEQDGKQKKCARVVVPDDQLSLAIGKEGQNASLAAKLTGYKIDIKSETQARELGLFDDMDFGEEGFEGEYEKDVEPAEDEAPAEETSEAQAETEE